MKTCSLVIIARPTEEEARWIGEFMASPARLGFPLNVVTNEFEGEDLDGWITRKKNIGVALARSEYCLVCHADTFPHESFLDALQEIEVGDNEALCPLGFLPTGERGLTWGETGNDYPESEFVPGKTYISGAAIFAKTALFRRFPWDESLFWQQSEDIELSRRLEAAGIVQRFEPALMVNMMRSQ